MQEFWKHSPYLLALVMLIVALWRIGHGIAAWAEPRMDKLIDAFVAHIKKIDSDLDELKEHVKDTKTLVNDIHDDIRGKKVNTHA